MGQVACSRDSLLPSRLALHIALFSLGSLHAVCARPPTRRLLCLTGVDHRIPLAATVDGALMFLAASRDARG